MKKRRIRNKRITERKTKWKWDQESGMVGGIKGEAQNGLRHPSSPSKDAETCQLWHRERIAELTVCMDQKDTMWTKKKQDLCPRHILLQPSCHGTLYLLLFCFPYYVNGPIFQDSIMFFFFKALMIWDYQVLSTYRLLFIVCLTTLST